MNVLQVENLCKEYKKNKVVNNLSFSLQKGEILGLLGPNGAGKSTTIEIIAGLKKATSGKIILFETINVQNNLEYVYEKMGIQLQTSNFYNRLTVEETIEMFLKLNNRIEMKQYHIDIVGIGNLLKKEVGVLSGGEKQKLSLTITLVGNPDIIILDEPTTGLDTKSRKDIWDTILKLRDDGKSIIITTHLMDEAQYLCNRIAIINNGKINQIDTVDNLLKIMDYRYKFKVKTSKPMNKNYFLNIEDIELVSMYENEVFFYAKDSHHVTIDFLNRISENDNMVEHIEIIPFNLEDFFLKIERRQLNE